MDKTLEKGIIPQNDAQRLEALKRYKILDTPPEESFNNIAHLMAETFEVPIALISLVDKDRVFFKGAAGMPGLQYTDRSASLCSYAILSGSPTVFDKPLEEPCLLSNPLVHGEFGLRFYAGAPLVTSDGYSIGAVCIVDKKERTFSDREQDMLVRFARLVMQEIELRHTALLQRETERSLRQSKERFELVAKATHDSIWDWNLLTDEIWWNEGFKALFGYNEEDIENTVDSWYSRVHPEDKERIVGGIREVIDRGGKNWSAEYRFRRKDGSYATVYDRGYVLHNEEGKAYRMLGSMQDVTERKEAVEALRRSEERLQKALSIETVGVIYFDLEGGIHDANAAFERMSGYPRQAFQSGAVRWDQLTPPEFMEATLTSREELLTKGQNTPYEKQYIRPDDSRWWGLFAGKRLSEGECVEFVVDITDQKEAEAGLERKVRERTADLEKLNEELKRSNAQLEDFAYVASHDLKEPVRKVHFFSDRLKDELSGKLTDAQLRLFERIEYATQRMGLLIEDLLTFSHLSRGISHQETIDLNKKVRLVLEDLELTIQEKGAKITIDPLPTIRGHRRQLQQLFQNLLSNALKYSKMDVAPQIHIHGRTLKGHESPVPLREEDQERVFHLLEIRDNGIGFEPKDAERIFGMFQRLHGKAEYEGTGIGLAIVQKVVENHGGYTWATAQPGAGATFHVLLPAE
jgi:PAS domain S-box-containing protein